jgi:O-antigen/teichoic acid export membrane protein
MPKHDTQAPGAGPSIRVMSAPAPPRPDSAAPADLGSDRLGSGTAGPRALRGSALRSASYVATIGLSLVSAPLLIRHLGIASFGRYTTVVALVTIVNGLTDAGLMNIALREWVARAGNDRDAVLRSLLGIRLELSAAGVALGVGFALVAGYTSVLVLGTLIAGVGMVLTALANLLSVPLQGELRFGWVSIIDVARQAVSVALIVVLVLAGAGLLPFFAVTVPAGLAMVLVAAWLVRGRMPLVPRFRGREWLPLVRDSLPYAAAIAVNTIYFRVTIVVMSLIASAQQTGYFATSFRVTEVLIGVPAFAIGVAFPILTHSAIVDRDRFAYATGRIVELASIAGVALVLAVVLSAPFVIRLLAGPAGAPAAPVLQLQGLALVGTFVSAASGYALLALHRHTALLISNGAALLANIALTLVLVPIDRARGAAIAAVIAETALGLSQLALLIHSRRTRIRMDSFPRVAIAGLAGASPLLWGGVGPVLRTFAGLLIYAIVITLVGRFPPELAHAFHRGQRN